MTTPFRAGGHFVLARGGERDLDAGHRLALLILDRRDVDVLDAAVADRNRVGDLARLHVRQIDDHAIGIALAIGREHRRHGPDRR
jgi:hypothetical protein